MAVVVPVLMLIAVETEAAIAGAVGAAILLGHAVHGAFQAPPHFPEPAGPGPAIPPRAVTPGEEILAAGVARRLDTQGAVNDFWEGIDPQQPDIQQLSWSSAAHDAAIKYRTITVAMTAVQGATIATPGLAHINSIRAQFPNADGIILDRLQTLSRDAERPVVPYEHAS